MLNCNRIKMTNTAEATTTTAAAAVEAVGGQVVVIPITIIFLFSASS